MNRPVHATRSESYALRLLRLTYLLQSRFESAQRERHPDRGYDDSTAAMEQRLYAFAHQIGRRPAMLLEAYRKFCSTRMSALPASWQNRLTDCCSRIELFVAALNPDALDSSFLLDAQVLFDTSIEALPLHEIGLSDHFCAAA
ncbi:MAG: hypothetical protein U0136_08585 [Bdellovibrionota bacterium]